MDEIDKSASDLYSAMREVVADRSAANVCGFVSVVNNRDPSSVLASDELANVHASF
jgi:hypothetical protein